MSVIWDFRCYLSPVGVDVIDQWYQAQPDKLKAKFDIRVRYLRQQPRSAWIRPYFDKLSGECAGLGEIRFEWNNVQYRPIGFFSGESKFVLVLVAKERGGKFDPRGTCAIAQRRKNEVLTNWERARDCDFD